MKQVNSRMKQVKRRDLVVCSGMTTKNRKHLTDRLVLLLGTLCITGYYSCIKDNCGNVVCNNEGVCVDGVCACPSGYEGIYCEQIWSDKFTGKWQADDNYNKDTVHRYYDMQINGTASPDTFAIHNLADSMTILCARSAYNKFVFKPGQQTDTFFVLQDGYGTYDIQAGIVTGMYSFLKRAPSSDTTLKDTIITTKFTWKK